jgi:hypothetical protein
MPMLQFFRWLSHLSLSVYLRHSTWGFAIIETAHLLGLAALGGVILIVDLRVLGIGLRRQPVSKVARELSPLLWGSLTVMLISGALLVMTGPMKYYHSPSFRIKMLLFLLAFAFYFTLHRNAVKPNADYAVSAWPKMAAVISLVLWLGVGLAGRAIGFLGVLRL